MSAVTRRELLIGRLRRALLGDAPSSSEPGRPARPPPVHDVSRDVAVYDASPFDPDPSASVAPDAAHAHEEAPPPWLTNASSPS